MKRSARLRVVGQADHAVTDELGGAPVVVTLPDGRTATLSDAHVSWTRGSCITGTELTGSLEDRRFRGRLCSALRCRHNLLAIAGVDMPGKRHPPRAARGLPTHPPGRPRPFWIEGEMAPMGSCALDVVDVLGAQRCSEIAPRLGLTSRRRVEQVARRALKKLRANGADETVVRAMEAMLDAERRGSPLAEAQDSHGTGKVWK